MKSCRIIQPLLYLYRNGELLENDAELVRTHCIGCPECRSILDDLLSADASLGRLRTEQPQLPEGRDPLSDTLRLIGSEVPPHHRRRTIHSRAAMSILRPALGAALLAFVCLWSYQSVHDSLRIADMERLAGIRGARILAEEPSSPDLRAAAAAAGLPTATAGALPGDGAVRDSIRAVIARNRNLVDELKNLYSAASGVTGTRGLDRQQLDPAIRDVRYLLHHFGISTRQGEF